MCLVNCSSRNHKNLINAALIGLFWLLFVGCKKLVQINPPINSITTSQTFADSSNMAAAVSGIYSQILYRTNGPGFCNGAQTIYCGLSSDELAPFSNSSGGTDIFKFYINQLISTNAIVTSDFWIAPFQFIYQANACIEGIENSSTVRESVRNRFIGEAKFLRALCYFYLVNIYGDIPYITSTRWSSNSLAQRVSKEQIFDQIISDLNASQNVLPTNYALSSGRRTRVGYWAVTALLSRVYLYKQKWSEAEAKSSSLINNSSLFSLENNLDNVFSVSSPEAILQWELNTQFGNYNATNEGALLVRSTGAQPFFVMSSDLVNAFENGDNRKSKWVNMITYGGVNYFVPYKYKIGESQRSPGATATEYYTVLRLGEQYLIRAEARAMQNNLSGAVSDLNIIRNRAGLPNISSSLSQQQVLDAIAQERRIELFAEWGHRWFDLKRTGKIDNIMSLATPQKIGGGQWQSFQQLYPIPQSELNLNPNLTQNPGY